MANYLVEFRRNLKSFRRGLVAGGDFLGLLEGHVEGYKGRLNYKLENPSSGEESAYILGENIGLLSNLIGAIPQVTAVFERVARETWKGLTEEVPLEPVGSTAVARAQIDARDLAWRSENPHDSALYLCPGSKGLYGTDGYGNSYRRYPSELTAILEKSK
jgi:hypothetical protein